MNAEVEGVIDGAAGEQTGRMTLEEYYEEAGPDYAAWSAEFNMHFGYFRAGLSPLNREPMLEQMNREVLQRMRLPENRAVDVVDLGCGLGAMLRSLRRQLPQARLTGVTLVPWQVKTAGELNARAQDLRAQIDLRCEDFQHTTLLSESMDAVCVMEAGCHAPTADKAPLLAEAHRLLRPGGRFVAVDGFLSSRRQLRAIHRPIYRKLCECWAIEQLAELDLYVAAMRRLGFREICVEPLQWRVAPSVFHIPWVTLRFLITDVIFGKRRMTRARWNNIIAPLLLPLVSWPLGPMAYYAVSATK